MVFIKIVDVAKVVRYIHPSSVTHLRQVGTNGSKCRVCTITDGVFEVSMSCKQVAVLFGFELKE